MKEREKIILAMGLFIWVVGDVFTTYIGFNMGIPEQNPFLVGRSITEITILKIVGAAILVIALTKLEKLKTGIMKIDNWKSRFISHYPKGILVYGLLITFLNSIIILGVV